MQASLGGSILNRMLGAVRLDMPTYEDIERDESATTQALIVVVVAGLAAGIGALRANGALGLVSNTVGDIIGWVLFSFTAYFVGTRLIPARGTSATPGQLLRTLGFAHAPSILSVFGFIPILGPLLAFVGAVWFIVCSIVALRSALEMSSGRAIGVALLSAVVWIVVLFVIALIFGTAAFALGG